MLTHAQGLVDSLAEVIAVSTEQGDSLATTRRHAKEVEAMFEDAMDKKLRGEVSPKENLQELLSTRSTFTTQRALTRRSEEAKFDAAKCLMRLYAYPQARATCEDIMELLREVRMMGLDDDPSDLIGPSPKFENYSESDTPEEARLRRLQHFAAFQQGLKERRAKRQARYDEQIAKSDRLLSDALARAKGLLRAAEKTPPRD